MDKIEQSLQRMETMLIIGMKNVLDVRETATMLGVTVDHIRHLVSSRSIPHYKKGARVYFKKSEIEDWQLETRIATHAELKSAAATHIASKRHRI